MRSAIKIFGSHLEKITLTERDERNKKSKKSERKRNTRFWKLYKSTAKNKTENKHTTELNENS